MKVTPQRLFLICLLLQLLILFSNFKVEARGVFFSERAYLNLGFGLFQCERFKETENEYAKKNLKISYFFNAGIGYKFSNYIRSDINFQYSKVNYRASRQNDHSKQDIRAISGIVNLYCDLHPNSFISPYIMVGTGINRIQPTGLQISQNKKLKGESTINLVWNVGVGVLLDAISNDYSIDIGYRYIDLGKIQTAAFSPIAGYVSQRIRGHQGIISVLFKF